MFKIKLIRRCMVALGVGEVRGWLPCLLIFDCLVSVQEGFDLLNAESWISTMEDSGGKRKSVSLGGLTWEIRGLRFA
jgi:hypothetical protein